MICWRAIGSHRDAAVVVVVARHDAAVVVVPTREEVLGASVPPDTLSALSVVNPSWKMSDA